MSDILRDEGSELMVVVPVHEKVVRVGEESPVT